MIKAIYGLNVAVHNLELASENYERLLGFKGVPMGEDQFAFAGLRGSHFDVNGFHLNLITSNDASTSVGKFLHQKGEGVFLLSIEVAEMASTLADLESKGYQPLLKKSAMGSFGAVNFLHPKQLNGVQIELFQPPSVG